MMDLLVLDADPTVDIHKSTRIDDLFDGEGLDREALLKH